MDNYSSNSMLDIFIYETTQNIEQLEEAIIASEKEGRFSPQAINEIFRIMHTIKGSSAMMMYDNISSLSHTLEDLFYFIREEKSENMDSALLSDLVLEGVDFIKLEMEKVKNSDELDGNPSDLVERIKGFLASLKGEPQNTEFTGNTEDESPVQISPYTNNIDKKTEQKSYEVVIYFEDGCEMENIRAYNIVFNTKNIVTDISYYPEDIIENPDTAQIIREQGFRITLVSEKSLQELYDYFAGSAFIRNLEINELGDRQTSEQGGITEEANHQEVTSKADKLQTEGFKQGESKRVYQNIISVDVTKLDRMLELMGEMVIAEAMVTQNPELQALKLNSFYKAARQLHKITSEMQDMVMSIRMVPLATTFHKMNRIVRDMSRKLNKEVGLLLIGENTEVDKNIIEHISDPLMHLVRNAIDHGIETPEERVAAGKPKLGQIILEAKNTGSDVLIIVCDDGKGLNKEKILKKARENGLLMKAESEMTDKEIYNLIFLPGFSTNDKVTEYSGRGVGMDVVVKNLEAVGGAVSVDSIEGLGTTTTLKIPLTLAIIDGMNIRVGGSKYTLPTTSIKETFQAKEKALIKDPNGNEMIMVRGECYPVVRLHEIFEVETNITDLTKGIMLMIEQDEKSICLFADELIGQQQVVVKSLPSYMKKIRKADGLAGCTLLGDGSISLILNISGLINKEA